MASFVGDAIFTLIARAHPPPTKDTQPTNMYIHTHTHVRMQKHHLITDLLAEERCLCGAAVLGRWGGCGGRLELSDFKWSRDEEISNFPPGCVSVGRCAPRCTGTYSSTRINHRCQPQVTGAAAERGYGGEGGSWKCLALQFFVLFFSFPSPLSPPTYPPGMPCWRNK